MKTLEEPIRKTQNLRNTKEFEEYVNKHPFFSLSFNLNWIQQNELPKTFYLWGKIEESMLNYTGIPVIIDYTRTSNPPRIIPGFEYKFGYAFLYYAHVSGSDLIAPSVEFNYILDSINNLKEKEFLKEVMLNLQDKTFKYLKETGNNLQEHKKMIKDNHWIKICLKDPKKDFIEYNLKNRTNIQAFETLFEKVEEYLKFPLRIN